MGGEECIFDSLNKFGWGPFDKATYQSRQLIVSDKKIFQDFTIEVFVKIVTPGMGPKAIIWTIFVEVH